MTRKALSRMFAIVILLGASPVLAPQLLAFPYTATVGQHRVYSEAPIDPSLKTVVGQADALVAKSPLASSRASDQTIFLTNGGWRWTWLALQARASFAISRPGFENIVVNRSDVRNDLVRNDRPMANRRTLHGTLAHEMTHGLIRARFGFLADHRYPAELREGYCDYVAGGGSLSDSEAQALIARGEDVPALTYWRGRKQVEAALPANRGNVDALFANWRG